MELYEYKGVGTIEENFTEYYGPSHTMAMGYQPSRDAVFPNGRWWSERTSSYPTESKRRTCHHFIFCLWLVQVSEDVKGRYMHVAIKQIIILYWLVLRTCTEQMKMIPEVECISATIITIHL